MCGTVLLGTENVPPAEESACLLRSLGTTSIQRQVSLSDWKFVSSAERISKTADVARRVGVSFSSV
jgi:hypothetical protein